YPLAPFIRKSPSCLRTTDGDTTVSRFGRAPRLSCAETFRLLARCGCRPFLRARAQEKSQLRTVCFRETECYNCVTSPRDLIEIPRSTKMLIKLTKRERASILAALRRWLSYPAAREADSIATNGGKYKPLDDAEIERLCKHLTEIKTKRDAVPLLHQSNNGSCERKGLKPRYYMRRAQDGSKHLRLIRTTSTSTREALGNGR